jgi:RNA polymerase sigma-70 factor (ECF subfamily)
MRPKGAVVSAIVDRAQGVPYDDDHLLIERFLGGDEGAFEPLYAKYYEKVFSIARGVLLDADDTADAVQEVFTLVYRNLRRFDRRSKFSTWLFRIAVNASIQLARKNKFKQRLTDLHEASAQVAPPEEPGGDAEVDAAMAKLNPADRALLAMFYWDELSLNDIAESLGCSVNAAKTRLYRARERFREVYEVAE